MPNFLLSKHFLRWQKTNRLQFFVIAMSANILHLLLLALGYKRLLAVLHFFTPASKTTYTLDNQSEIKQLKKVVNPIFKKIRTSQYLWSNCLSSSILLWYKLKRQNLDTYIIIGAKKDNGQFKAHAWVEYNKFPLNENKAIRGIYAVFEHDFSNKQFF